MSDTIASESTHTGTITIEGPEPLVIDPSSAKRRPPLEREEARMLTAEIQRTSVRLWLLVTEAHDRAAHFALGYESWDDYVRAEFKMSPSRSYQLLDTGHVMRAIAEAGGDLEAVEPPPARVISRIKNRLPEVRKAARQALKEGESPNQALRDLAREPQRAPEGAPTVPLPRDEEDSTTTDRRATARVTCPGCNGEGKVNRSMANRLRAFVRTLNQE